MEKIPNQEKEIPRLEYLTANIGLVRNPDGKYLLAESVYSGDIQNESSLEHIPTIRPDGVLRPEGDTTIFTSAGIQHLETLERNKINLESEKSMEKQMERQRESEPIEMIRHHEDIQKKQRK